MDFSNVHILLCDHDSTTVSEIVSLLQKCSYKVTSVKTARQMVDVLKSEGSNVDVVLTDVELPKEDGFKMLRYILRHEDLGHIAVVVMSEQDEMAVVAKCLSLGAVDYLVKPLRLNEVMNLWTHMWRKRRAMKLSDKEVGITRSDVCSHPLKPAMTADLLTGYRSSEPAVPAVTDVLHRAVPKDDYFPQVELSLRLSLNYADGKLPVNSQDASISTLPSPGNEKTSAFSAYLRSCNQQPDEQSGTNACSSSSSPSKRSKYASECINQDSVCGVPQNVCFSSPKEVSGADETGTTQRDGQISERSNQLPEEQLPSHFISAEKSIFNGGQTSPVHVQGFQPCFAFMGLPPSNMQRHETSNDQDGKSLRCNLAANPSPGQTFPMYYHESGVTTMPPVANMLPCYSVAHFAVPVVSFSTWPALVRPPALIGSQSSLADRREAALSKFRMKRKGRCFEKKIRYASRKKLAEQRPRVRGQFVKRSVLAENMDTQAVSEEEGEADDEQGCSEFDNQSSPDCVAVNGIGV